MAMDRSYQTAPQVVDRAVCAELNSGRDHQRFCSGLAVDRGGVVCVADGVLTDCWSTVKAQNVRWHFCHLTFYYTIQITWIILYHQKKDPHLKFHQIVQHILFYPHGADISPKG